MVLLFGLVHLLYMKSQKGKIKGSKKVDLLSLLWLDAMLMLGSFQQLQTTVVPDPSVKCMRSPLRRGSQAETVAPSTHAKGRFHSNHCY
jgi:hypothetical protein